MSKNKIEQRAVVKKEILERGFQGIWIPKEIWLNDNLNIMEKLFYVEIDSLDNEEGCFASNDYFAKFFDLSKNRCSEIIKSLEKKGYINIRYEYKKGTKSIEKRVIKCHKVVTYPKSEGEQTFYAEPSREIEKGTRNSDRGIRKTDLGYSEKCEDNNTIINNTINNIKKEKKKTEIDLLIEDYTSDEELKELLIEFVKMRKGIKASITTLGMKKLLGKLDKISISKEEKIEILNNSIMNSWKGIFELKKPQALPTAKKQYAKTETTFKKGCGERTDVNYDDLEKQFQEKNEDDLKSIDRASSILNRIGI